MSTLKPVITTDKLTLTAEHEVRSRIWDLLNPYRDHIWFDGPNKTQLTFGPNPGYTSQQAMMIVIANLYLAQENDFLTLWVKTPKQMFSEVLGLCGKLNWHFRKPALKAVFEDALVRHIVNKSWSKISNKADNTRTYGYNTNVIYERWQGAVKGLQKLNGMSPEQSFLTKEEWESRAARLTELIAILEAEYHKIRGLDKQIDDLKEIVQNSKKAYERHADSVKTVLDLASLQDSYTETLETIQNSIKAIEEISFDEEPSRAAVREAKTLVPVVE